MQRAKRELDRIAEEVRSSNKVAFVFANGPSLRDIDLGKIRALRDEGVCDVIAINSFLSKSAGDLIPDYAVFADNLHFAGGDNQYSRDVQICKDNGVTYFVPVKYCGLGVDGNMFGYNPVCDVYGRSVGNVLRASGYYGVTAFYALTLAKMLPYKKMYICGFDNSYFKDFLVRRDGALVIRHRHYYDGENDCVDVPCLYDSTSGFFFDVYRHFHYLEKIIESDARFENIAKTNTYLSGVLRNLSLDVYKD